MKTLETSQIQQVSGGQIPEGIDNKPQTVLKTATSTKTPNVITAATFSTSRPEGMLVQLARYDALFMAPSNNLSDDQPLFPGFNDQGGSNQ